MRLKHINIILLMFLFFSFNYTNVYGATMNEQEQIIQEHNTTLDNHNKVLNEYLETTLYEYNFITKCVKVLLIIGIVVGIFKLITLHFQEMN